MPGPNAVGAHHKFVVIDRRAVFLGGGHLTSAAFTRNYETFAWVEEPRVVAAYARRVERLFLLATDLP